MDQLCAVYTCGRSARRWPLCVFYCILGIIWVNSHIIYSHFKPNSKQSKYRREFLNELGYSLVRNFMIKRLDQKNLSRELRTLIIKVSGIQVQETYESTRPSKGNKVAKYLNNTSCDFCPRSENKKCTIRCTECNKLVCNTCKVICCKACYDRLFRTSVVLHIKMFGFNTNW